MKALTLRRSTESNLPSSTSEQLESHQPDAGMQSNSWCLSRISSRHSLANIPGSGTQNDKIPKSRFGRCLEKACESYKTLVRALSLSLVIHVSRGVRHAIGSGRGRGLHEPIKLAIRHSRPIALLRALIHLIPFSFALFEIVLNWNIYYVGAKAYNTAVYQVIAKAHEISIQASITAIIFAAVRWELTFGEGLPFGLFFAGLQISQISYLWSVELWGAMRADYSGSLRKLAVFTLVIVGIVLGVTCGPSSAVLLTPRVQLWPAGRTHIWINATNDQVWPTE